jgi:hypothetical protein
MVRVVVTLPDEFVAVTVYRVRLDVTWGVPTITPALIVGGAGPATGAPGLSIRPNGRSGVTENWDGAPPVIIGTFSGIGTPVA